MKAKEILIKFFDFFVVCAYALGAIGGTAYLFYFKEYLFGATNLMLAAMAVPFLLKRAKDLINHE